MTRRRSAEREVQLRIDIASDFPGTWRAIAECDDEITAVLFTNTANLMPIPTEDDLAGEFGASMLVQHQRRCKSCQRWATAPR